jgi:hypothetical protein
MKQRTVPVLYILQRPGRLHLVNVRQTQSTVVPLHKHHSKEAYTDTEIKSGRILGFGTIKLGYELQILNFSHMKPTALHPLINWTQLSVAGSRLEFDSPPSATTFTRCSQLSLRKNHVPARSRK